MIALWLISYQSIAQVAVSSDGLPPDGSAMLDVRSTSKGFLAPRLTFTEMNTMVNPATGLMVYCKTTGQYYFNKGTPAVPNWVASFYLPFSGSFSSSETLIDLVNTGTGGVGSFVIDNAANYYSAVYAQSNGPGWTITSYNMSATDAFAGYFRNTSPTNNWPAIQGKTAGTGPVFRAYQTLGPGGGLDVHMLYTSSTAPGIAVYQSALGNACQFYLNNAASSASALHAENNGTGDVGFFQTNSPSGSNAAVKGRASNTGGGAGAFEIFNPSNSNNALYSHTQGTGGAGAFNIDNPLSTANALWAGTNGIGSAGAFNIDNVNNPVQALVVGTNGLGNAGSFYIDNKSNSQPSLWVGTNGTGNAASFNIDNATNSSAALAAGTNGTGSAGAFNIDNTSNSSTALSVGTNGTGSAGSFIIDNVLSSASGLYVQTNGVTEAIKGASYGTGNAGFFAIDNGANQSTVITALTNGTGTGGHFKISNLTSTGAAVYAETGGIGASLVCTQNGTSGNIAVFQSYYQNKARIDKTGKGFFNGGTQNSGADVAELFDVEGPTDSYGPGDVMVISETSDRKMEKSSEAVSTKVAGVYATKPGVILTEKDIEDNLDELVPIGVIGVIPTKVCDENGPIKRGDLLVTSSKPGHAMKAIPINIKGILIYPTGAILGKALENFENGGQGLIRVLVNVK